MKNNQLNLNQRVMAAMKKENKKKYERSGVKAKSKLINEKYQCEKSCLKLTVNRRK
jgi:hypothetical protein